MFRYTSSFDDNCGIMAHDHQDTHEIITHFLKFAKTFGPKISLKKTDYVSTPSGIS